MNDTRRRALSSPAVLVLGLLLAMAGCTALLRTQVLARVESSEEVHLQRRVSHAFGVVDDGFQSMQREMVALAEQVAQAPTVRSALRGVASTGLDANLEDESDLVDYFSDLRLPRYTSLELYTQTPQLVAWTGFTMPLDRAPESPEFLQKFQTTVARDREWRVAVVLWWPISDGPRVYGTVRVMRIVRSRAPVQNEYLRDYDIGREWSRRADLPVELYLAGDRPEDTTGAWRDLRGVDGEILGQVRIGPPTRDEMLQSTASRFDTVLAFWLVLAAAVFVARLYRRFESACADPSRKAFAPFLGFVGAFWAARFVLLSLDFPTRLQGGKSPFAPLFDPSHFASDLLWGAFSTTGDLMITSALAAVTGISAYRLVVRRGARFVAGRPPRRVMALVVGACVLAIFVLVVGLAVVARSLVLDGTLDYFVRTGLLPESLVLSVFASALVFAAAVVIACATLSILMFRSLRALRLEGASYTRAFGAPLVAVAAAIAVAYAFLPLHQLMQPLVGLGISAGVFAAGITMFFWQRSGASAFALRNTLAGVFVLSVLLYPLLHSGLQTQKRATLVDAAEAFDDGSDPRAVFSIERVLEDAAADSQVVAMIGNPDARRSDLDSLATQILRESLLASLRSYEVSLTFVDVSGQPRGRYYEADQQVSGATLEEFERSDLELLRLMYTEAGTPLSLVEQITGRHERERFRYVGLRRLASDGRTLGWVMAGAEPHTMAEEVGAPFPRVLVSTGFYGGVRGDVSLAEFRDGVLVRNTGLTFGRFRLEDDVATALRTTPVVWRRDRARGTLYDTYYARQERDRYGLAPEQTVVVAARAPATTVFDHLYALLRLTVAGLFVGIPIYLVGVFVRWNAGNLPAARVRFRDKVLNSFFGVGIVTVAAMGFVGLQVVNNEGERAVESWLRQHLERVERTLASEARAGELPYRVLDRMSLDSLSARVGLDLNLFQGAELEASSRPQLVRDRLIDTRLPIDAYRALNFAGFRFFSGTESVGTFTYTAGYRALPDEAGRPRYVVSVPTLPEQDRLDEERARTIAYLFGALLLLVLVVLATASVLANALTRPVAQLREGLEAAARGRYEGIRPVSTRDEFADLVETFNAMQGELSDQRRRIAQQERQLAWQEMARQVAHEIKNPLTPMKLSVQHLRRSLDTAQVEDSGFRTVFTRITGTLVEQIDALARIANEFSSFARMPRQILEPVDLNTVLREAVTLMQSESGTQISTDFDDEPLVVNADREELRRAYINLLKNGLQSVPPGRTARVRVRSFRDQGANGHVAVSEVVDNGAGIPDDLADHIFEPNFSTKTSGTGLGLAIVRKAVTEMHGTISFRTQQGRGTTFTVTLPLADEDNP